MSNTPLTNDEGEVRELMAVDIRHGRPAATALPDLLGTELAATLRHPGDKPGPRATGSKFGTALTEAADKLGAWPLGPGLSPG